MPLSSCVKDTELSSVCFFGSFVVIINCRYVVQLSTICTDEIDGRKSLEAAVQALFVSPQQREADKSEADSGSDLSNKPKVLWSMFYIQALQTNVEDLVRRRRQ